MWGRLSSLPISEVAAKTIAVNRLRSADGRVFLQNPTHEVEFAPDGVTFRPNRGPQWTWRLEEAKAGGVALVSAKARVAPGESGKLRIDYDRGALLERYVVKAGAVEQQFVLPRPPAASGDLEIVGRVECPGAFEEREGRWSWGDEEGRVWLGKATALDARGNRLPAAMSVSANQTRILIAAADLAQAAWPVVIDPEIGVDFFQISDTSSGAGSTAPRPGIAYNKIMNEYLVAWAKGTSGSFRIVGQRLNAATGAVVGANEFPISNPGSSGRPAIAWNEADNEYLVVWGGSSNGQTGILGQRLAGGSGAEIGDDFPIEVSNDGQPDASPNGAPDVVWNAINQEYLVVFTHGRVWHPSPGLTRIEYEIYGRRIASGTGSLIGASALRLSDAGGDDPDAPGFNVNASAVAWNARNNQYLVVWDGPDTIPPLVSGENEIFAQRLDGATGAEIGPNDYRISDMGPDGDKDYDAINPDVAWNGRENEYLVVWSGDDNSGLFLEGQFRIFGQRLDGQTGAEMGDNDFRISDQGPFNLEWDDSTPSMDWNAQENTFLVAWHEESDDPFNAYDGLFGRLIGSPPGAGALRKRNTYSDPDGHVHFLCTAWNSQNNNHLIAWSGALTPSGDHWIFGAFHIGEPGNAAGPEWGKYR